MNSLRLRFKSLLRRATFFVGSLGIVVLPASVAISCGAATTSESAIKFGGLTFNSTGDLANFLKDRIPPVSTAGKEARWQIDVDGTTSTFDDINKLINFVDDPQYVKQSSTFLSDRALKEQNGLIEAKTSRQYVAADSRLFDTVPITTDKNDVRRIFRGNNDALFFDEDGAIDSFLQTHQAYTLDDMIFANKSDLEEYLRSSGRIKDLNSKQDYFLQSEQGVESLLLGKNPLSQVLDLSLPLSKETIADFVRSNAEAYLKNSDNKAVKLSEATADDIATDEVPYYQVENSNGRASYIIDVYQESGGALFGPYVLNSAYSPVFRVNNKDFWVKSDRTRETEAAYSHFSQLLFSSTINTRLAAKGQVENFSQIVFSDPEEFDPEYKAWLESHPKFINRKITPDFYKNLTQFVRSQALNVDLFQGPATLEQGVKRVEEIIRQGQNYGFLNAISILRSWAFNQLINHGVPTTKIDLVNLAFDNATYYLNYLVHVSVDQFVSDKAQAFNFAQVFDFANSKTYGEDPIVYVNRLETGQINQKPAPEITEMYLAFPITNLFTITANELKRENPLIPESRASGMADFLKTIWMGEAGKTSDQAAIAKYFAPAVNGREYHVPFPKKIDEIDEYIKNQTYFLKLLRPDAPSSPTIQMYGYIKQLFEDFASSETQANPQGRSTLRANSKEYESLVEKINNYFELIDTYWKIIDPDDLGSEKWRAILASQEAFKNQDLSEFKFEKLTATNFGEQIISLMKTKGAIDEGSIEVKDFETFVRSDFDAAEQLSTFNDLLDALPSKAEEAVEATTNLSTQIINKFKFLKVITPFVSHVATFLTVVQLALEIVYGILGEEKFDTYTYSHNREEATYYWNGGTHREHDVFGFKWESKEEGIKNEDILSPITIRSETTRGGYYYGADSVGTISSTFYSNLSDLKKDYLRDLRNLALRNKTSSRYFEYGLTLRNGGVQQFFSADTIEALAESIMNHLATSATLVNERPTSFRLPVGEINDTQDNIFKRTLEMIRPIFITQFPIAKATGLATAPYAMPISEVRPKYYPSTDPRRDVTLNPYQASQQAQAQDLYRLREADRLAGIDRSDLYLVMDKGYLEKALGGAAPNATNINALVRAAFKKRYQIESKFILLSDFYTRAKAATYEAIPNLAQNGENLLEVPIYVVRDALGEVSHFLDRGQALQKILISLNFTRLNADENAVIFTYRNKRFATLDEMVNWVLANQDALEVQLPDEKFASLPPGANSAQTA